MPDTSDTPDTPDTPAPASTPAPTPMPDTPAPIYIRHDLIFGSYARTTPAQTAAIADAFEEEFRDINPDPAATKRLHRDGLDLVVFRYESESALLANAAGTGLNLQTAPPDDILADATNSVTSFPYPIRFARLLTLGEVNWSHYNSRPPDYYQKFATLTPADIPDLLRLCHDPEIIHMETHGEHTPMWWARFHAVRALAELRAPGTTRLMLDNMRDACAEDPDAYETHADIDDAIKLIPRLDAPECAIAIAELRDLVTDARHDRYAIALVEIIENIAQNHPALRDACRDAACKQLENHPFNTPACNGFLVSALLGCKAAESAPLIEQAYAAGNMDLTICGDLEDVQIELGLLEKRRTPAPRYTYVSGKFRPGHDDAKNTGHSEDDGAADDDYHAPNAPPAPVRHPAPKIGRNAPCPCGSGKKYKKCCMEKDLLGKP